MISFERKIYVLIGILAVVLLVTAYVSYHNTISFVERNHSVEHSKDVLAEVESAFSTFKDAEIGERGYILSEQPIYLAMYDTALKQLRRHIVHLRFLTSDNPVQQDRISRLDLKIKSRLEILDRLIALKQKSGIFAVQRELANSSPMISYLEIRQLVMDTKQEEERLLQQRMQAAEESAERTAFSVAILTIAILISYVVMVHQLSKHIRQRKHTETALSKARDQALLASKFKSEFVANISHEIRTPMNAIIGMINALLRTELTDDQRKSAATVRDAADALLSVINDILDYSKVEAGKLGLEFMEFDPVSVVESVGELLAVQARSQQISLMTYVDANVPAVLFGDPGRLRQILLNLAANAIKFSKNGEVVIRAMLKTKSESMAIIHFEVADTGVGMTSEEKSRLFQPFVQASASKTHGGTGLGLTISKHLTEMMGGVIDVESTKGKGSTFWCEIPFGWTGKSTKTPVEKPAIGGLRVCVVDDEAIARHILHAYLDSWGMRPAQATSADEAIDILHKAKAQNDPYDVLLVDLVMPGKDGMELASQVKDDPKLSNTKMILITAHDTVGLGDMAIANGFSGYLTKPVRQSELLDCIATVMGRALEGSGAKTWTTETRKANRQSLDFAGELDASQLVLVVEDNKVNQQVAILQLQSFGISADTCANGAEAIRTLALHDYGLILMDCQMPEMDGFDATKLIRKAEMLSGRHIPIIAMTAQAMEGDREKCIVAGMDDYISKPIDAEKLLQILQRWIPCKMPNAYTGMVSDTLIMPGKTSGEITLGATEMFFKAKESVSAKELSQSFSGQIETGNHALLLDVESLNEIFGRDSVNELLEIFDKSTEALLQKLATAIDERNLRGVKSVLHELKGSSSMMRALYLQQLSLAMEASANNQNWEELEESLPKLEQVFSAVQGRIKSILPPK
jgi:polar amino acid transport system substrate-binding protein